MKAFDERYEEAEGLRKRWRLSKAVKAYMYAQQLSTTEDEECDVLHMLGVTYKMWGKLKKAEETLLSALDHAADDVRRGNILRDLADTLSLMGNAIPAYAAIKQSLAFLEAEETPYASTLGFKGRLLQRTGELDEAVECYDEANERLEGSGAPELFNLVPYTNALLQQGTSVLKEGWWNIAFELCDEYGTWVHRLRLVAMRRFGYRADNFIQKLLPLQRFIPFI